MTEQLGEKTAEIGKGNGLKNNLSWDDDPSVLDASVTWISWITGFPVLPSTMPLLKSQISILTEVNFVRMQTFIPEAIRTVNKCQALHFTIRFLYTLDSQLFKPFTSPVNVRNSNFNVTESPRAWITTVVTGPSVFSAPTACQFKGSFSGDGPWRSFNFWPHHVACGTSPTRDQAHASSSGSVKPLPPTGPPGKPFHLIFWVSFLPS